MSNKVNLLNRKRIFSLFFIITLCLNFTLIILSSNHQSTPITAEIPSEFVNYSSINVSHPSDLALNIDDPTNHTISWNLTDDEAKNYDGLYSFTEIGKGGVPANWTIHEDLNTNLEVISEKDGHSKVIELFDNSSGGIVMMQNSISRVSGTVEFWVQANFLLNTQFNLILEQSFSEENINFIIRRDVGTNWIGLYTIFTESFSPNTWYHVRLEFNCTTDKVSYWLDGNYKGEFDFNVAATSINNVRVQTSGPFAYADCRVWVDAIDYSWSLGYYTNRNMDNSSVNYLGEYSFLDDPVGNAPAKWLVAEPDNSTVNIIAEESGHSQVVKFETTMGENAYIRNQFPTQANGETYWECWVRGSSGNIVLLSRMNDKNNKKSWISFGWDTGELRSITQNGASSELVSNISTNLWYHIRIQESQSDKCKVWLNNGYKGEFNVYSSQNTINEITLGIYLTTGISYIDGIDFSWASGYYSNRNQDNSSINYLGEYSFLTDSVMIEDPPGWLQYNPINTSLNVITEESGHKQVIKFETSVDVNCFIRNQFLTQSMGETYWECWVRGSSGNLVLLSRMDGTELKKSWISFNWDTGELRSVTQNGGSTELVSNITTNLWYHIRIQESQSDKCKIWLDNVYKGEFNVYSSQSTINEITIGPYLDTGVSYVDAIDYSWALGYYINRNMDFPNGTALNYAIFQDDVRQTAWQQWSNQVLVDYNVSAQALGKGLHNISLVYNNEAGLWYNDDVIVNVTGSVVVDWNVPADIDIEIDLRRDRDCNISFQFQNTGNATLLEVKFTIDSLPIGWNANVYSRAIGQLAPNETTQVSFVLTVPVNQKEFMELVTINFTATIFETGQNISDEIHVLIAGVRSQNLIIWLIVIIGSVTAVATTSTIIIRRKKALSFQITGKLKSKSLVSLESAIIAEFPTPISIISSELMDQIKKIEDLSDSERKLLLQDLAQLDEDEILKWIEGVKKSLSN